MKLNQVTKDKIRVKKRQNIQGVNSQCYPKGKKIRPKTQQPPFTVDPPITMLLLPEDFQQQNKNTNRGPRETNTNQEDTCPKTCHCYLSPEKTERFPACYFVPPKSTFSWLATLSCILMESCEV